MTAVQPGVCPLCGPDYPRVEVAKGPDFDHRTTGDQEFRFTKCTGCGTLVLDPRPADDRIAALYPLDYVSYSFDTLNPIVRMGRDLVQRRKAAAVAARVRAGGTIVDVGCGTGTLLRSLRARYGSRFRLIGWDYPGPHLAGLESAGVEVIGAPIEPAHVPRGVDLFILNQVVEHVPYPDRLLTMLRDGLAPGGLLVIETPDTNSLDAHWFAGRYWGGYHLPRHMVLFSQHNLRALVERCGLRVVESKHLASPAFWVQSLNHALLESRVPQAAPLFVLGNAPLVAMFSLFDLLMAPFFGTSNQRLVVQRPV